MQKLQIAAETRTMPSVPFKEDIAETNSDSNDDNELFEEWGLALDQRFGKENPACSSSKQKNPGSEQSRQTEKKQNQNATKTMSLDEYEKPERCFIDPSNHRVIAVFADGKRKALGNSAALWPMSS